MGGLPVPDVLPRPPSATKPRTGWSPYHWTTSVGVVPVTVHHRDRVTVYAAGLSVAVGPVSSGTWAALLTSAPGKTGTCAIAVLAAAAAWERVMPVSIGTGVVGREGPCEWAPALGPPPPRPDTRYDVPPT